MSAFHGDNYEVLVHRHFIKDRAVMFELAGKLDLVATSTDDSVLAALEHAQAYRVKRRDFIPMPAPVDGDDPESGIASPRRTGGARSPTAASRAWWPGGTSRRWCSPTWPGNYAPATSPSSAPGSTPTGAPTCSPGKNASRCWRVLRRAGLPATAAGFTGRLRQAHLDAAAGLDAGYEDNADLVIGEGGIPTLKRRRGAGTPAAAEHLAEAIARRMPERSLLGIVARTAHWLGWHHHFGPASGSDPKISDPRAGTAWRCSPAAEHGPV